MCVAVSVWSFDVDVVVSVCWFAVDVVGGVWSFAVNAVGGVWSFAMDESTQHGVVERYRLFVLGECPRHRYV